MGNFVVTKTCDKMSVLGKMIEHRSGCGNCKHLPEFDRGCIVYLKMKETYEESDCHCKSKMRKTEFSVSSREVQHLRLPM